MNTQAERVLADRRWFTAGPEQYDDFVRRLDQPMDTTKLAVLFARGQVFDAPFELDE